MKTLTSLTLALSVAGCAPSPVSIPALCSATKADRRAHAGALIEDGGPKSAATGAIVLSKFQRGCQE